MTLPINERKLQDLVSDAKDFMYGLGKEFENMFVDIVEKISCSDYCVDFTSTKAVMRFLYSHISLKCYFRPPMVSPV